MKEYKKREKSELEKRREEIVKREKLRPDLGSIRSDRLKNLLGCLKAGQIFLSDIVEILNYRLLTRDGDMIRIWRQNQGNPIGELAAEIVNRGLLSRICFDNEGQRRRVIREKEFERKKDTRE